MVARTAPDAAAFAALYQQWRPLICRDAARWARTLRLDPAEVHHDAVAMALGRFDTFDPARAGFPTWMNFYIRSAADRASRRRRRRVPTLTGSHRPASPAADGRPDRMDPLAAAADPAAVDPADAVPDADEAGRLAERVRAAVAALPPRERAAVERRFGLAGKPAESVANREKYWLARGLAMLRDVL